MSAIAWSPHGFLRYRELFPNTPSLEPLPSLSTTERFAALWTEFCDGDEDAFRPRLAARAAHTTVVFVRGYLGGLMPGNLAAPCRALRRLGFDAFVAPLASSATVVDNVAKLGAVLDKRGHRARVLFCGHSKGGLESLALLQSRDELSRACDGVLLSQTPRGSSRVLECLLEGRHGHTLTARTRRLAVTTQRGGLLALGGETGGRELIAPRIFETTRQIEEREMPWPVLQTSSWSTTPTSWLDSFHLRLGEIRPGCAHDGQFYLDDLLWPGLDHVLLPHLDHAQPVMGGHGFAHDRYWLTMLALLYERVSK